MFFKNDYVIADGSILPPPSKRWGGNELKSNEHYLKSAEEAAIRIRDNLGCNSNSHVLDIGCGQGRLPIGILRTIGTLNYTGIDVHKPSIRWCKKHIQKANPSFQFKHLNAHNERYNKAGLILKEGFQFDIGAQSADIIYLYSVFTHMIKEEMELYLKDFKRILRKDGKIFFSVFLGEDKADCVINPSDFRFEMCRPLHVVRYNEKYLISVIEKFGYRILDIKTPPKDYGYQQFFYLSC